MSEIDNAPVLYRGVSSAELTPWVVYLQQLLTMRGTSTYQGPEDGNFDERVEAAVRHVQQGMRAYAQQQGQALPPEDGVVTKEVWEEVYRAASMHEAMDDMTGAKAAGYRVENEDGDYERRVAWNEVATGNQQLAPGREVGRTGWVHGSLQCSIVDFKNSPYSGPIYVVFTGDDNAVSDESGTAHLGTGTLANIWLPVSGTLRVTLEGTGDYPLHGPLSKNYHLSEHSTTLGIRVEQIYDERKVTVEEAESHGWVRGWQVQEGLNFKVTAGPAELGWEGSQSQHGEESHSGSHGVSQEVTVRLPTPNLKVEPVL